MGPVGTSKGYEDGDRDSVEHWSESYGDWEEALAMRNVGLGVTSISMEMFSVGGTASNDSPRAGRLILNLLSNTIFDGQLLGKKGEGTNRFLQMRLRVCAARKKHLDEKQSGAEELVHHPYVCGVSTTRMTLGGSRSRKRFLICMSVQFDWRYGGLGLRSYSRLGQALYQPGESVA